MRLAITVTETHIAHGVRCNGNHCPVALAAKEALGIDHVTVDVEYLYIGFGAMYQGSEIAAGDCRPTPEIRDFIERFDDGKPVVPATFFLEVAADYFTDDLEHDHP